MLVARTPVIVALVLVPVAAALAGGFGPALGPHTLEGIARVGPVAVLIMFAILYFGLMIDVGLFDPLVRGMIGVVGGDPVRLCLASAVLPMLVALDGDGATTFLISITALLPVHRRMGIRPVVLPGIVALSAGVMNLLPWGGPTARAITALGGDVGTIFMPVVPAMLAGIAWVFLVAGFLGWRERQRLVTAGGLTPGQLEAIDPSAGRKVEARFYFNAALTALLLALLFQDLYAERLGMPKLPATLLFMIAFAIALPVNRRDAKAQQDQVMSHGASAIFVTSMIFAAGVFTGILNGTGMIKAMATVLSDSIPTGLSPWLSHLVAVTSMPLTFVFTPDAYYFGVLPVFANTAAAIGHDPLAIGRAAILGQSTTGFPLSPLIPSTFILIGLSQVTLRDHQRFVFLWAFGTTVVMTVVAGLTGAL